MLTKNKLKRVVARLLDFALFIWGVGLLLLAGIFAIYTYGWWGIPIMLANLIVQVIVAFSLLIFGIYFWYVARNRRITGFWRYITRQSEEDV